MKRLLLLGLFLTGTCGLTAACASAPAYVAAPTSGLVTFGTQAAIQATQGAALLSGANQQAAQATADEAKRQADLAYQVAVMNAQATGTAVANQAALDTLRIAQTQSAAVSTQNAGQRQAVLAVTAEYRKAERAEVAADIYLWGGVLTALIFVITLLFGAIGILHALEKFTLAIADERKARAAQMLLATAINGGQLQFSLRDQAWEYLGLPEPEHAPELGESTDRDPVIVEHGRPVGTLVRNVTDAERLLTASLRAGYTQDAIAPATTIKWDGMRRRDAVNSLRPYVRTKEGSPAYGGGTYIEFPYRTVSDLLNAIRRGDITPAPTLTAPESVSTVAETVAS